MTIVQLEYIVAVNVYKSFSIAASHCFVTQPTLSMQVQKLEEELGVQIFDRTKNPIVTTNVGERLIQQANSLLLERDKLQLIIENEKNEFAGVLKIGIIPTISSFLLPFFLKSFLNNYPKVDVVIDELTTAEIISNLHKSVLDIGILALPIHDPGIAVEFLFSEPFVGFIPKNHRLFRKEKLDVADLNVEDLLLLKEGHCLREQTLRVCKTSGKELNAKHQKVLFEFGNLDTLVKLVQQNFGMTLLPYLSTKYMNDEKQLRLVREFNPPVPKREIGLVHNKIFIRKHLVNALKKEILNSIPRELLKNKKETII